MTEKRILVAITGASGTIYAQRLCDALLGQVSRIYLVSSPSAKQVAQIELSNPALAYPDAMPLNDVIHGQVPESLRPIIRNFGIDDLCAPIASGSSAPTHMVVIPCSMGSLARIATGISSNLIERSADVMLKQKRPLILVPRETPLNSIHLRHMLTLSDMGASILPAMPAFYQRPSSVLDMVDFVVGRVLEMCEIPHELYSPWNARMR